MMSGTVRRTVETAVTKRYEALLRVSQTLISIRSSEELFSILARELRAVMNFSYLGVAMYDEKAQEVRLASYSESGVPRQVPKLAAEETLTWWVYQHQQCLIIPSLDAETRFPAVAEMLKNCGVRSVCALPLTTLNHRLGGLAVGSVAADAYSGEEVSFLSLVANQVALAVGDALDFDASQHAQELLRGSEESFRLIVDSIPGLVVTMTAEGELEFVSQQCLDYFGMTLDELKGWTKLIAAAHLDDWALWHGLNGYERRCWHCGGRGPIAQCEEQGSQPHNPVNHRLLLKKYSAIVGLESGARKLPGNDVAGNDVMHWLADRKVKTHHQFVSKTKISALSSADSVQVIYQDRKSHRYS